MDHEGKRELLRASWIGADLEGSCPVFCREFQVSEEKRIRSARLLLTAVGVYEASINGQRVGRQENGACSVLSPGVTCYEKRLQFQSYEVAQLLQKENTLTILLGPGWYRGRLSQKWETVHRTPGAVRAVLWITFEDGSSQILRTDESFYVKQSGILQSDLYDGEYFDASRCEETHDPVRLLPEIPGQELVEQECGLITEHEHLQAKRLLHTPDGRLVLDFGQNLAGYAAFTITAKQGERVVYTHAEELDANGNAYLENYRSARVQITYVCREGEQAYRPHFCFMGFRYVVFLELPEGISEEMLLERFEAIAIYTDMKRTGWITSGNVLLNQLYSNTLWSQRANFIDIPTDCPQRDERMGWTGDAQVFCRTASYQYDVKAFFEKWCRDLRASQLENGAIPDTVPNFWQMERASTAWGDVICILPWQMYLSYGDSQILEDNFDAMTQWVDYITKDTLIPDLWISRDEDKRLWGKHYGDWLALDAPEGSYKGSSRDDFIASAFYFHSAELVVKSGHVLGREVFAYEQLKQRIAEAFGKQFSEYQTQTERVLALQFGLAADPEQTVRELVEDIRANGCRMKTGFVGTPYLLHVLSTYHYEELCYELLLQESCPSWLFSVKQGATTIWEHWDGKKEDGSFWSADMNSFNHDSYGSVFDWVYGVAAGICPLEEAPGYRRVRIAPHPDKRLGFLEAAYDTAYGRIRSAWSYGEEGIRYEITTPVPAECEIAGKTRLLQPGSYVLYSRIGS